MFRAAVAQNVPGYFLILVGLTALALAACFEPNSLVQQAFLTAGGGLISAGLLAFKVEQKPTGNTATLELTTPPPQQPNLGLKGDLSHIETPMDLPKA